MLRHHHPLHSGKKTVPKTHFNPTTTHAHKTNTRGKRIPNNNPNPRERSRQHLTPPMCIPLSNGFDIFDTQVTSMSIRRSNKRKRKWAPGRSPTRKVLFLNYGAQHRNRLRGLTVVVKGERTDRSLKPNTPGLLSQ
jgi:hypothetical protein